MLAMALGMSLPALAPLAGPVALMGTLAYILSFAVGAGPVPGLLVPEITPAKIRGGSGLCEPWSVEEMRAAQAVDMHAARRLHCGRRPRFSHVLAGSRRSRGVSAAQHVCARRPPSFSASRLSLRGSL